VPARRQAGVVRHASRVKKQIHEVKMKKREALIKRKTKETDISGKINIDGQGKSDIKTGIDFLDHMLTLFAFHGLFDLTLKAKGDLGVDLHHTNEDVGITLGKAFKEALGDCAGIKRFGSASVPMDEASAKVIIDIGGRYSFNVSCVNNAIPMESLFKIADKEYSGKDALDFFETCAKNMGINLNIEYSAGKDLHHTLEAIFKAFGIALDQATQIDPRRKGVPSTKGVID